HRREKAQAKRLEAASEADRKGDAAAKTPSPDSIAVSATSPSSAAVPDVASASSTPDDTRAAANPAKPSIKQRVRAFIAPYLFPQVAPYLAISFARRVPKGLCISFVLVFAKHAGIAMGAAFFIAAGATTLVCRLCGGKLFDSDKTWLLWPLLSVQIIGFAILAIAPSFATLLVAAVGYGISVGTSSPFVKTITAKATPKEHWGVVNGEVYFFGDLGKATGAFVGGLLIDATAKTLLPEIALGFALFTSAVTAIALLVGRHLQAKHTA
ncbi:MAG: MFS transporter, partial [Adlercreutzia sp.]|nr:MFS transporter [Adlercreutzia sp.]